MIPKLKEARLSQLYNIPSKNKISLIKEDILHFGNLQKIFEDFKPDVVVNLAAQAGNSKFYRKSIRLYSI